MPILANRRRELFSQLIASGMSGVDAYLGAGYRCGRLIARNSASRLLANASVKERVEELTAKKHGNIATQQVALAVRDGRPTNYRNELNVMAKELALLGLSDEGISRAMRIPITVFAEWRTRYPRFRNAVDEGRDRANGRVASALFKKATGYEVKTEKLFQFKGEVVRGETVEYVAPDTAAASFWLRNRAPDYWKERREVDVAGSLEHRFSVMTPEERLADARALADEMRRALIEAAQTIDGEAEEIVEPPRDFAERPPRG